ncbi:MAG: 4Fe-4S cluster-binding domain-containing protein [Elusimicrobia bacterium]|nr:4Fe-4S cluster-binding domain-containing protein [Elusimicrobiota bacterium]
MNFLLTYKCQSCCKFCFVPKELKKEQKEMSFLQFKKYLDHIKKLYKNKKPLVGILGGEPTLAKDFPMIIGYAKSYKGGVRLYSNLITATKNIEYLLGAKNILLSWNVSSYIQASAENKKLIIKNLKLIKKYFKNNILASITLYSEFKINDFSKVIKILKRYNINNIRIALDSTNYKAFINYGTEVFAFIKHLRKLKFNLYSSACGHFIKDIFTTEQEKYLKQNIHNFKYNNCSINYPLDILPDGTVIPCVSFSNRNKKINFLKYNTLKELKLEISKKFNLYKTKYINCVANKY